MESDESDDEDYEFRITFDQHEEEIYKARSDVSKKIALAIEPIVSWTCVVLWALFQCTVSGLFVFTLFYMGWQYIPAVILIWVVSILLIGYLFHKITMKFIGYITDHAPEYDKWRDRKIDEFQYGTLYKWSNGTPSTHILQSNARINRGGNCSICLEPLNNWQKPEVVLECGHRYHAKCIRDWERQQRKNYMEQMAAPQPWYICPNDRSRYDWTEKYEYTRYTHSTCHNGTHTHHYGQNNRM